MDGLTSSGSAPGPSRVRSTVRSDVRSNVTSSTTSSKTRSSQTNMAEEDEKMSVKAALVSPSLTCTICEGYFVNPTTSSECLHTFCKSCILQYVAKTPFCPICGAKFNPTQPERSLLLDRTMADVMHKVFPGQQNVQERREAAFYQRRNVPRPNGTAERPPPRREIPRTAADLAHKAYREEPTEKMILVCLERGSLSLAQLERKFVIVDWSEATVGKVKQHVAMSLYGAPHKCPPLSLSCSGTTLTDDNMTMKEVVSQYHDDYTENNPVWLVYDRDKTRRHKT